MGDVEPVGVVAAFKLAVISAVVVTESPVAENETVGAI